MARPPSMAFGPPTVALAPHEAQNFLRHVKVRSWGNLGSGPPALKELSD